ncbi:MAG: pseudouridine synthase [Burkholderiaceae bacterium]|nr:pseudouridine synthase [Burkholderiaceae bacterium]
MSLTLERILHSQGISTRRACRALILAGRVTVHDSLRTDPFSTFEADELKGLHFCVDGQAWQYQTHVTLMMHKPTGYECSRAPSAHSSVFELLPLPFLNRGIQPVGRLDQDTSGLLLFTDDGKLNHKLSAPKYHVPKVYHVTTSEPVTQALVDCLLNGVVLKDSPQRVAALSAAQIGDKTLSLTISEGKYHQVKRMIAAAGHHVRALQRVQIGELTLPDDLEPGNWQYLDELEFKKLF